MRLLIFLLLGYIAYRLFKNWFSSGPSSSTEIDGDETLTAIDDIMVKDPYCKIYIPQRNGIKEVVGGQTCYFCSTECRDKYLEAIKD